jgi:fibronectin-binding autotransporter adhesin
MSEYIWTGAAGDGDFGDGNNWINENSGLPGEPTSADLAVLEAAGLIKGAGSVNGLDFISSGGVLTAQALGISAMSVAFGGTINLTSATQFSISDDVAVIGTSKIVQSNGSSVTISGNDGTAGDVVTAMTFGQNSGDNVAYTLTGLGTQLDATDGNIMIGGGGTGAVTVAAGATLEADNDNADGSGNVFLGGASGALGTLVVTGPYTTMELAGGLNIGAGGTGHFTLSAGADAELGVDFDASSGSTAMIVGSSAGGIGTAVITGAGTRFASNIYGAVTVGGSGTGTMTISAGATANFGELNIATAATGNVTVTGVGSTLQLHEAALVGYGASGTLQILAGAHMAMAGNASNVLAMGELAGSNGKLVVSGAGSVLSADNDQTQVGFSGTGSAVISAGGVVTSGAPTSSATNTAVFIGTEAGSVGTATVENATSSWTAHGEFDVGYFGTGTLLVESGGAVSSGNYNTVVGFMEGNQAGSSGTATVTGAGSKLTNSGRFIVGNYGVGVLSIAAAATVTTTLPAGSTQDGAILGGYSGGSGRVTVSGAGSTWSIGADLVIGDAGSGVLTIGTGGMVHAASLLMAITGAGTLNLSGTSTKLTVSGNALFGDFAKAQVAIGSGSLLSVGGTADLHDGHIALTGGGFTVTKTLSIDAGQSISGFGTVQTGGLINAGAVQASGGTMTFAGSVTGTGVLQISNGATLSLDGAVGSGQKLAFNAASENVILGSAATFAGVVAGFISGDKIDLSSIVASSLSYSGQTLTVHESGGASIALKFAGAYTLANFANASDGHGGTFITHT